MCGITGIYNLNGEPVDKSLLEEMTSLLAHRGPDSDGTFIKQNVGLGFRRLSVLDLAATGDQPMCNADQSLWLVYNGEFYNHNEYRSELTAKGYRFKSTGDTETLLCMYEEYGKECLQYINGMFAFAVWNEKKRELFLARDRVGIKPLYYYLTPQTLIFSSEIKSILKSPVVKREIEPKSLNRYLSYTVIPGPETIYKNIFKLMPGHSLVAGPGGVQHEQYWDLDLSAPKKDFGKDAGEIFLELMDRSIKLRTLADVPVGSSLSGGVDSSTIVARLSGLGFDPINTFSISFKDHPEEDEGAHVAEVSRLFNTRNNEREVKDNLPELLPKIAWHFDEPYSDSSAVGFYNLSEMARKQITVMLAGDGADEVFGGYPHRHTLQLSKMKASFYPDFLYSGINSLMNCFSGLCFSSYARYIKAVKWFNYGFKGLHWKSYALTFTEIPDEIKFNLLLPETREWLCREESAEFIKQPFDKTSGESDLTRMLYADLKTTLADDMLTKVDRMSMAHGLEVRVPFLDHHLIEFAASLPDSAKIQDGKGKHLIRKSMEPQLPASILDRKKHGFNHPVDHWFRADLKEYAATHLSRETIRRRGYFDPNAIERIFNLHWQGKRNYGSIIYNLLMFELWHQTFMDQ